jgi:cytochrome P450 PksS
MIFLLLLAGHETTVNLIGNGTLALLQNPAQLALLHAQPGLIERAVEELLRFTNPVEHGSPRIVLEDLDLLGVRLPRGSKVLALLSSANRDETVFERPDELLVDRDPNPHVAFGAYGRHHCLGAPLARLELRVLFQELLRRMPDLQLVEGEPLPERRGNFVLGLESWPVEFTPVPRRAPV